MKKRSLSWVIALGMNAALFAFVALFCDVRFALNDDSGILRAFLGYETGTPASFHIYIHGLLAKPLYWLSCAFPGVMWYSWMQLALLFLAQTVISKSIMQCFVKHEKPLWLGAMFALIVLCAFAPGYTAQFTFTQTAAFLGAAAVLQLFSIDFGRKWKVIVGMLGAAMLSAFAYALRQITLLPVLAFCALAFLYLLWEHRGESLRPMLISLGLIVVLLGSLVIGREIEIRQSGYADYLAWQDANAYVIDYYGVQNLTQEELELVGWSQSTVDMAYNWCFLNADLSTENFLTLNEALKGKEVSRPGLAQVLGASMKERPAEWRMLALGLLSAVVVMALCVGKQRMAALAMLLALLGACAMLCYLATEGRLPLRAVLMVLLPFTAFAMALLPRAPVCIKGSAVIALVMAAWMAFNLCSIVPGLLRSEEDDMAMGSAFADMEEYAVWEPESLFIYDGAMIGADTRAFPEYPDGIPHNVTFWGGWGLRSPENIELFENFGIDLMNFEPETFLRDDVFLVTSRVDPPPTLILNWLRETVSPDIDWEIWSECGSAYILHFYEY